MLKSQENRIYYLRHRAVSQDDKICLCCGQKFSPKRKTRKTCSDKCRKFLSRQNKLVVQKEKSRLSGVYVSTQWIIGSSD